MFSEKYSILTMHVLGLIDVGGVYQGFIADLLDDIALAITCIRHTLSRGRMVAKQLEVKVENGLDSVSVHVDWASGQPAVILRALARAGVRTMLVPRVIVSSRANRLPR